MDALSDGDASIDEDELLEALEEEEEGAGDQSEAPGSEVARKQSLESLGGDLLMRIMGMLSVAQLCTLSGRARPWLPARRLARASRYRPRAAASALEGLPCATPPRAVLRHVVLMLGGYHRRVSVDAVRRKWRRALEGAVL